MISPLQDEGEAGPSGPASRLGYEQGMRYKLAGLSPMGTKVASRSSGSNRCSRIKMIAHKG